MKKSFIGFLLVALLPLALISCSKDDDGPGSSNDFIGTWQSVSEVSWEKEDGEISSGSTNETPDTSFKMVFTKADCTSYSFYSNRWYEDGISTWKYKGSTLSFYDEDGDLDDEFKVLELTATKLVIESHDIDKEDGITYEDYSKITFKRISDK